MAALSREELLEIFYYLAKTLTPEEVQSMTQDAPGAWQHFTHLDLEASFNLKIFDGRHSDWEIHNLDNVFAISHRIQEIVDARIKQHLVEIRTYGNGLPKIYLAEIASRFLNLDIAGQRKLELIDKILKAMKATTSGVS